MKTFAIIPAYNEHQHLSDVVKRTCEKVNEVIIIDDGSAEVLRPQIDGLSHPVRLIRHRINLGKGASMKTGLIAARRAGAEVVVFLDADGQHRPEELPSLLEPIKAGRADLTIGTRAFSGSMPLISRLGNLFLTTALRVLFGVSTADTQSGYRAFRTQLADQLEWQSARYAVETEMLVNAGKHHLRIMEVPIQTVYHDKYKGTTIMDGIRIFLNLIAWRLQ